jgi:hypothetical protein
MIEAIEALHFRPGQELEIWEDQGKGKRVKVRYLVVHDSRHNVILSNGDYTFAVSKTDIFFGLCVTKV